MVSLSTRLLILVSVFSFFLFSLSLFLPLPIAASFQRKNVQPQGRAEARQRGRLLDRRRWKGKRIANRQQTDDDDDDDDPICYFPPVDLRVQVKYSTIEGNCQGQTKYFGCAVFRM